MVLVEHIPASHRPHGSRRARSAGSRSWRRPWTSAALTAALALTSLVSLTFSSEALASEPSASSEHSSEPGKTRFGMPRLAWSMAPPLQLQPERARVTLQLPPEWMPAPSINVRGIYIPTTKDFAFRGRQALRARATIGSRIYLHLSDPSHALDFGLSLSGRSAVAVLRFDPLAWGE